MRPAVGTDAPDAPGAGAGAGAGGPSAGPVSAAARSAGASPQVASDRRQLCNLETPAASLAQCGFRSQLFQGRKVAVLTCQPIRSLV